MGDSKAWEVINTVVSPRITEMGLDRLMRFPYGTIMSSLDWSNGVAMYTPFGTIHVLGSGEIVDTDNVLKLNGA